MNYLTLIVNFFSGLFLSLFLINQYIFFCLLIRLEDFGKPKAQVVAKRVMERVTGVNIIPHFSRIEDKHLDFYNQFSIVVLGLDSIEARSCINFVACDFLGVLIIFSFLSVEKYVTFVLYFEIKSKHVQG